MIKNYLNKSLLLMGLLFGTAGAWSQITTFDYTGSIETYTVPPDVSSIQIETRGAQGGNVGGEGAIMIGTFDVTPGEVLTILVGQEGGMDLGYEAGGGGGSFVANAADEPLIVAGGGGGRAYDGGVEPVWTGIDANTTTNGNNGNSADGGSPTRYGVGGIDGNGSTIAGPGGMGHAGNGGGFYTDGSGIGTCGGPGLAFLSGGAGGGGCSGGPGGFGGGANGGNAGGGGGGGYSGGGGAYHYPTNGGGGGSFNDGTDQDNSVGNTGNGQIIIEVLCEALTVTVSSEEICLGDSFNLDAEGAGDITWDGGVINGEDFTPDETGVFTYTATSDDDGDCGFTIDIEVLELPEVTASVDADEICIGESIVLTGGGADEYEWFPLDIEDGEDYTPDVGEYTYTVIGTDDETGCENIAEVDVSVYDLPEVVATITDEEICLGESVTLNGEGATTYVWDPAEEDGVEFTPDATGTTTYTVVGTDDNGCVNEADIDLTVYEALELIYVTSDEIFGSDGSIDLTVTGGSTPYTYDWDNDGTGDFDDTEDLTGLTCGTYVVVVMCDAGCTATETIEVGCQVGIEELNGLEVSVYPNPAAELVTISLEGTFNYTLSTINGDVVLNGNGFNTEEISLDEFAKGIYMINVFAGDQSTVIKLVKK
jgi:hypothetical protein